MLSFLGWLIYSIAGLYLLVLVVRMVFDWLQLLVPSFPPRGVLALFANLIYAASDPPIRWLRARIPPLHLGGGFALDVGFILLFIALMMLQRFSLLLMSLG